MTLRERVSAYVAERVARGRLVTPAQAARDLGAKGPSVRAALQHLRDTGSVAQVQRGTWSTPRAQATLPPPRVALDAAGLTSRVRGYIASTAGQAPETMKLADLRELLARELGKGVHSADQVIALLDSRAKPATSPWFRPRDLATQLGLSTTTDQAQVRRVLQALADRGLVEYDPKRAVGDGRWRGLVRPAGHTLADVHRLIPPARRGQNKRGIRAFVDNGGQLQIAVYSPEEDTPDDDAAGGGGGGSLDEEGYDLGGAPGEDGEFYALDGYRLGGSRDPRAGGLIATLRTRTDIIQVIDVDSPTRGVPDGYVAIATTPRGAHYYLPTSLRTPSQQDASYAVMSHRRGYYAERLFDADGSPRALPQVVKPTAQAKRHRVAFARAQAVAILRGWDVPRPFTDVSRGTFAQGDA